MRLLYKRLNRDRPEQSPVLREAEVSREELHVRKLVDATLFDDGLYEHTSNSYEGVEVIYLTEQPERRSLVPPHRLTVYGPTLEYYDVSGGTPRLLVTRPVPELADLITRLLDHFTTTDGRDWELTYTILDEPRGAVMLFVVPE